MRGEGATSVGKRVTKGERKERESRGGGARLDYTAFQACVVLSSLRLRASIFGGTVRIRNGQLFRADPSSWYHTSRQEAPEMNLGGQAQQGTPTLIWFGSDFARSQNQQVTGRGKHSTLKKKVVLKWFGRLPLPSCDSRSDNYAQFCLIFAGWPALSYIGLPIFRIFRPSGPGGMEREKHHRGAASKCATFI